MSLSSVEQKMMQTAIVRQKMSTLDEEGRLRQVYIQCSYLCSFIKTYMQNLIIKGKRKKTNKKQDD